MDKYGHKNKSKNIIINWNYISNYRCFDKYQTHGETKRRDRPKVLDTIKPNEIIPVWFNVREKHSTHVLNLTSDKEFLEIIYVFKLFSKYTY